MFSSIRLRLLFSHLAVIILAMGLSGVLLLSFLENYFLQATEDSLIAQARITAQALIPEAVVAGPEIEAQAPLSNAIQQQQVSNLALQTENVILPEASALEESFDLVYLSEASLQLGAQLETRIRILDSQGMVLVDSWDIDSGADMLADTLVVQALAGEFASRYELDGQQPAMDLVLPATIENQIMAVIYLSQPLRDVIIVLQDMRTRLFIATAIALLLSLVVGLILSGAITRPIRRLTSAASAIARGHFDQQVPVNTQDELGQLSRVFNNMTSRLQAARQMQIDFVANVSHELRTPLTSLKVMIETLQDGAIDDLEVRERFLQTMETETNRLVRLVNDLLLLSQVDSQALNLRLSSQNLESLAMGVITRLEPEVGAKDLSFSLQVKPDLPNLWADPDRVEQILLNLLDNALKYSQPGGVITVDADLEGPAFVRVQVIDQGSGIPEKDLPRIGQRFYRTDSARSRSQGGSGLGVAIVKALVEAHGGQFWLESQPGEGTRANFTLPISPTPNT